MGIQIRWADSGVCCAIYEGHVTLQDMMNAVTVCDALADAHGIRVWCRWWLQTSLNTTTHTKMR